MDLNLKPLERDVIQDGESIKRLGKLNEVYLKWFRAFLQILRQVEAFTQS